MASANERATQGQDWRMGHRDETRRSTGARSVALWIFEKFGAYQIIKP
jgi:hypothetical protein